MFTRFVLPVLGGSPSVWNTALVFYQAVLLAGYAYAHYSTQRAGVRKQSLWHMAMMLLPLLVLPIGIRSLSDPTDHSNPVVWLLLTLTLSVGLPFFLVSAGSPLIQQWFAHMRHDRSHDPYFLYASSNVGSMVALLAYPLFIEPNLTLRQQSVLWSVGYGIMLVLFGAMVWTLRKQRQEVIEDAKQESDDRKFEPAPTLMRRFRWVLLAVVPVSLMMGVTTFLTTDIASMPLLWALPLALYLLTFIIAFGRVHWVPLSWIRFILPPLLLVAMMAQIGPMKLSANIQFSLALTAFFLTALSCHCALASDRPGTQHLTSYFLLISLGGVIGGGFCALLAPFLFPLPWEYSLSLLVGLGVLPSLSPREKPLRQWWWVLAALGAAYLLTMVAYPLIIRQDRNFYSQFHTYWPLLPALVPLSILCFRDRKVMAAGGLGVLIAAAMNSTIARDSLFTHRGFFGTIRVSDGYRDESRLRYFVHGTTTHGAEAIDGPSKGKPIGYYHFQGPMGEIMRQIQLPNGAHVAVVGMGSATVAGYARSDQSWTYYEIDPAVIEVATNPRLFRMYTDAPGTKKVVLGDARASIAATTEQFDMIILAAYSSDAIPVHLTTVEAFEVYLKHLKPGGIICSHIANRFMDLQPVLSGVADRLGLVDRDKLARLEDMTAPGGFVSEWTVLARKESDLQALAQDKTWLRLKRKSEMPVWTDDYSSVVSILYARETFFERLRQPVMWAWVLGITLAIGGVAFWGVRTAKPSDGF